MALFISIFATTPLLIIFSSIGGLLLNFKRISNRILKIDEQKANYDIWKSQREKLIVFYCFFNVYTIILIFYFELNHL